jgi:hypothetical protein
MAYVAGRRRRWRTRVVLPPASENHKNDGDDDNDHDHGPEDSHSADPAGRRPRRQGGCIATETKVRLWPAGPKPSRPACAVMVDELDLAALAPHLVFQTGELGLLHSYGAHVQHRQGVPRPRRISQKRRGRSVHSQQSRPPLCVGGGRSRLASASPDDRLPGLAGRSLFKGASWRPGSRRIGGGRGRLT